MKKSVLRAKNKKSAGPYGSALKSVDEQRLHHTTALPTDPHTTKDTNRIRRRRRVVLCGELVMLDHNTMKKTFRSMINQSSYSLGCAESLFYGASGIKPACRAYSNTLPHFRISKTSPNGFKRNSSPDVRFVNTPESTSTWSSSPVLMRSMRRTRVSNGITNPPSTAFR